MTTTLLPEGLGDLAAAAEQPCTPESSWVCQSVSDALGSSWGYRAEWLVSKPLTILLILAVAFVVNRLVRFVIKRALQRILQPSERARRATRLLQRAAPAALRRTASHNLRIDARVQTLTTVFRSVASVVIWFMATVTCLQVAGVNVASLIAIGSVAGVALGFGAQNIVRDFLAGLFIVLEDQFGVGDIVDVGHEARGTVEELTLRVTKVRDVDGTLWHVPNGQIQRVANKTQEWARAVLDVEVDGGTDYPAAAGVIRHVAEAMAAEEEWMTSVLAAPELWGVESFTAAGYTVRLVVKTRPGAQSGVLRELRLRLLEAFAERGVVLPGGHWALERTAKEPAVPAEPGGDRGRDGRGADQAAGAGTATPHPQGGDPTAGR